MGTKIRKGVLVDVPAAFAALDSQEDESWVRGNQGHRGRNNSREVLSVIMY